METSTKILLAGLAAFGGLSIYAKKTKDSFNPFALLGETPIAKTPAQLPAPSPTAQLPATSNPNSPELLAAQNALARAASAAPNSPEVLAAQNALAQAQSALPNSPEAAAATKALTQATQSLGTAQAQSTSSPELQAAQEALASLLRASPTANADIVKVGDVVNVDMFRSGMSVPQGVPVVGLIFMNVVSMDAPGDTLKLKLVASFVSPEFRIFGDQIINRSSIVGKA